MTALVALVLAGMYAFLKPTHKQNESLFNKKSILSALGENLPKPVTKMSDSEIEDLFTNNVEQIVLNMDGEQLTKEQVEAAGYIGGMAEHVDMKKEKKKPEADRMLPLYIYNNSGEKYYIVSVRGNGLWDEIWGNIALEDDLDVIAGVAFDHQAETPGLGAEIKDNKTWVNQFTGKEIFNDQGEYESVTVVKAGAKDPDHEVDGISGATITADGVTEMMQRGIKYYTPYFDKLKQG